MPWGGIVFMMNTRRDYVVPPRPTARLLLVYRGTFFFLFITLGLELSDAKVYEPYIRALLGTASHYCGAVVLESVPRS